MTCIDSIRLDGFLSFPPGSPAFELQPLNVLIGPNGSGKSNFIDAFGLLAAAPHDFAAAARAGGAEEWLWKGDGGSDRARIEIVLGDGTPTRRPLRYGLEFGVVGRRVEVLDEIVEEVERLPGKDDVFFYYRFQKGRPAINVRQADGDSVKRGLRRESLLTGSVGSGATEGSGCVSRSHLGRQATADFRDLPRVDLRAGRAFASASAC